MGSGNKSGRSNIGGFCDEEQETIACDVGLGLKTQHLHHHHRTESSAAYSPVLKKMNSNSMSSDYNLNHAAADSSSSSSFLSGYCGGGDAGGFGGENRNFFSINMGTSNMCDAISTPASVGSLGGGGGAAGSGQRNLPAAAASSQFNLDASFKYPWETRAFTETQRQELERQTVICKYMMACVPVPPELLSSSTSSVRNHHTIPFNSRSSTSSGTGVVGNKGTMELRFASSNDPEPWRCRRTDGKKWRCSRDVAPDQKYCERHSHKGRPSRSRKPVESSSLGINHHTRPARPNISLNPVSQNNPLDALLLLNTSSSTPTSSSTLLPLQFSANNNNNNASSMFMKSVQTHQNQDPSAFLNQTAMISSSDQYSNHFRYPTATTSTPMGGGDWFMKRTATAVPASLPVPQPLSAATLYPQIQLAQFSLPLSRDDDPSDFNHKYGSFFQDSGSRGNESDQNCILPRQFLDTWSSERDGISQMTNTSNSISSSLTLSMSGGGAEVGRDDEESAAGLGIGLFDSNRLDTGRGVDGDQGGMVQQGFNWMISPGSSWMASSPPGGPLAEALCLGISSSSGRGGGGGGNGEASPMGCSSSGRTSSSGGGGGTLK